MVRSVLVCRGCGSCSNSHSGSRALSVLGNHRFHTWSLLGRTRSSRGRQGMAVQGVLRPCLEVLCIDFIPSLLIRQMDPLRCRVSEVSECGLLRLGEQIAMSAITCSLYFLPVSKGRPQILLEFGDVVSHHLKSHFVTSSHRLCGDGF